MLLTCLLACQLLAAPEWLWRPLPIDGGGPVTALAASPHDPARLLAGGLGNLLGSTDGGRSWQSADRGLAGGADRAVAALAFHPTDDRLAFAAVGDDTVGGGLFVSADAGRGWRCRSRELHFAADGPRRQSGHLLTFDPLRPGRLWVATVDRGVAASADGGQTATFLGPEGRDVRALARAADGTLYAVLAPAGKQAGPWSATGPRSPAGPPCARAISPIWRSAAAACCWPRPPKGCCWGPRRA
jgi:hypothetical protein